jgi:hypothetical protein
MAPHLGCSLLQLSYAVDGGTCCKIVAERSSDWPPIQLWAVPFLLQISVSPFKDCLLLKGLNSPTRNPYFIIRPSTSISASWNPSAFLSMAECGHWGWIGPLLGTRPHNTLCDGWLQQICSVLVGGPPKMLLLHRKRSSALPLMPLLNEREFGLRFSN